MSSQQYADGGVIAKQGFRFESYSLLHYLLLRRLEFPQVQAVFESSEGEDAKFTYETIDSNGIQKTIVELIQCKITQSIKSKKKSSSSRKLHASFHRDEVWQAGDFSWRDFHDWVMKQRGGHSAADWLTAHTDGYYTALVFGELDAKIERFIPKALENCSGWYIPQSFKGFPIDYQHPGDRLQNRDFSKPDPTKRPEVAIDAAVSPRVRVLPCQSPAEIEVLCKILLAQHYEVSDDKVSETLRQLLYEIDKCTDAKQSEANRCLSSSRVDAIIEAGKAPQGKWQLIQEVLDQQTLTLSDPNQGEPLRWQNFASRKYWHREEFDKAWQQLKAGNLVVVCGPAGTGKTTLCRFLAFKFLEANPECRAYYLTVKPGESFNDEMRFLKRHLDSHTLFIIDDEQFAPDEVKKLSEQFSERWLASGSPAKLVFASTITHGSSQAIKRDQDAYGTPNQVDSIRLLPIDTSSSEGREKIVAFLDVFRSQLSLHTPLSNETLLTHSGGFIGKALVLARCSQAFAKHHSITRLLEQDSSLQNALREWILTKLGRSANDAQFFQKQVVPIFILANAGLKIPQDFNPEVVHQLYKAGFIAKDNASDIQANARVIDPSLSRIISQSCKKLELATFLDYFRRYSRQLPSHCVSLCVSLTSYPQGRIVLRQLCEQEECFEQMRELVNDQVEPLGLDAITKILRSIHRASSQHARRLVREIIAPKGDAFYRFFSGFLLLQIQSATPISTLKNFLKILYEIDRYTLRQVAKRELPQNSDFQQYLFNLFQDQTCRLDEIAACLHALSQCHRAMAADLYNQLRSTPAFAEKITETDRDPCALSIWIKFCEELRPLNRGEAYEYLNQYVSEDRILQAILSNFQFNPLTLLLLRLYRIYPKLSARVAIALWDNFEYQNRVLQMFRGQQNLNVITNELYSLSRSNRRVAVRVALEIRSHIRSLVPVQDRYSTISSALESLHKNVGLKVAVAAAEAIPKQRVLQFTQQEDRKIDVVGKFLTCLSEVSPDIAAWFAERLDYKPYLERLSGQRLRNLTYIVYGFLRAASSEVFPARVSQQQQLKQQFLSDAVLREEFRCGWEEVDSLTDIALCLSFLLNLPLSKHEIAQLLKFGNIDELKASLRTEIAKETKIISVAYGLYAAARLDLETGIFALEAYERRFQAMLSTSPKAVASSDPRLRRNQSPKLPQCYEFNNLVELSYLLQIAAAISPAQAAKLADKLELEKFAYYATDEANLGRLANFITGLHRASRCLAREFLGAICHEEVWRKQYEDNENLRNLISYAQALRTVSRSHAAAYVQFLLNNRNYQLDIQQALEAEANLTTIANWLKMLSGVATQARFEWEQMADVLRSTAELDTRIQHLLEITEVLTNTQDVELAIKFAELSLAEAAQIASIKTLKQWITLFHKALRIAEKLNWLEFPNLLFTRSSLSNLTGKLQPENQVVLAAYTFHLLQSSENRNLDPLKNVLLPEYESILDAARQERRIGHQVIALILLKAPPEEITAIATESYSFSDRLQPWEQGLASLLFDWQFPDANHAIGKPRAYSAGEWQEWLEQALIPQIGNLEFGLTLHLAKQSISDQQWLARFYREAKQRADDESVHATVRLLQTASGKPKFKRFDTDIWIYLQETCLRSTYLTWEEDIEQRSR